MSTTSTRFRLVLVILALVIGVVVAWQYAGRWGHTPPFRSSTGEALPGSIAEMHRMKLGGVEQSVTIRGRSANAPILIWLHGGPGQDETGLWRRFNASLEDHFLVVYWTQRGTGRSYSNDIPASSMTIAQFVSDLNELVGYMQTRFGAQKVVLAGHSWGSSIAVAYAQTHPHKVSVFVGISQVVNATEGEKRSWHFTVEEAKRRGDDAAYKELLALGEPPYPTESILVQRGWLEKFGAGSFRKPTSLVTLMWQSFGASEVTVLDGVHYLQGADFSLESLAAENAQVDWWNKARSFAMPVVIATGRFDRNTDADLQKEWFDRIEAPAKEHFWFEESAHSPLFEEPDKFNSMMIETVLPLALAGRS